MLLKFVQSWNAYDPIVSTLSGNATTSSDIQPLNAPVPISINVFGRYIFSKNLQFSNAYPSMVSIFSEKATVANDPLSLNEL